MQCTQGKIQYPNRVAAHRAADAAGYRNIRVYEHDGHWHYTRDPLRIYKTDVASKTTGPAPYTPSAKTLRGRLRNAALEIRACDRRLAKAEAVKARADLLAAMRQKQSELVYESEMQAISEMIGRLKR
jgi:hypothetical protein